MDMTPEERLNRIDAQMEKQNESIQGLIATSRLQNEEIQGLIVESRSQNESIQRQNEGIQKQNEGIQALIVVSRTVLTSIQELRTTMATTWEAISQEMRERSKALDEKLNILIDTVDRIIRKDSPPS